MIINWGTFYNFGRLAVNFEEKSRETKMGFLKRKTRTSEEAESQSGKVLYSVHSFMTPLTEDMQK